KCSFFSLSTSSSIWSIVMALISADFMARLLADALDEARLDRQLGRGKRQRFLGDLDRDAIDFEQDATRLNPSHPQFRGAFASTHAYFERLLRDRHVRKHSNPDTSGTLHVTGECAPRRLDLARRHPFRLNCLQSILAEGQIHGAGGDAVNATLVRLAELGS